MSYLALAKQAEAEFRVAEARLRAAAVDPAELTRVLGLPLDQLDRVLEVRVPWLPVSLWFVPDEQAVGVLMHEGITRGRIWTAAELVDLLGILNITKAGARSVAIAKVQFEGMVTEVRPL